MRSSKSRSRKSGRSNAPNRSVGNIINRVFDSSGPEGKVRGTPQQIIDKYNQLARDAQLGNDRVAMENFQQHAEHYLRLLAEAQREIDQRREQQERENRDRQSERDQQQAQQGQRDQSRDQGRDQGREQGRDQARDQRDQPRERQPRQDQDAAEHAAEQPAEQRRDTRRHDQSDRDEGPSQDVLDLEGDSGLVDTPESKSEQPAAKPAGRARGEARAKPQGDDQPKPKPRSRAPRKPREPRPEGGDTPGSSEAAE